MCWAPAATSGEWERLTSRERGCELAPILVMMVFTANPSNVEPEDPLFINKRQTEPLVQTPQPVNVFLALKGLKRGIDYQAFCVVV